MTLIYETTARHGQRVRVYYVEEFDVDVQRGEDGEPEWVSGGIARANWEQFPLFVVQFPLFVVRQRLEGARKAAGGRRFANGGTGRVRRAGWQAIWVCPVKQWPQGTPLHIGVAPYVELSTSQVFAVEVALDYFREHGKRWEAPALQGRLRP